MGYSTHFPPALPEMGSGRDGVQHRCRGAGLAIRLHDVRARPCRFCGWAREYESDKLSRILGVYQQQALEVLGPVRGDLMLDVGCGSGAAVRNAAATVDAAVGADACPHMIERARRLGAHLPRTHFVVATADTLPFADDSFTAVLCTSVLRHVRDRAVAAREMARVLVPGGRIVVGDFVQDLSCNRGRAARRRTREAALTSLPSPDLVVGPHLVCSTVLGPYLITHATKACKQTGAHLSRRDCAKCPTADGQPEHHSRALCAISARTDGPQGWPA